MVRASILCVAVSVFCLAACKRADEPIPAGAPVYAPEAPAPEAQTPATTEGEEIFATVEQAESAFARAEQELVALQGPPAPAASAPAAPAGGAPAEPPAEAAPAPPPPAQAPPKSEAQAEKKVESAPPRCHSLCQAFSSLARAADAVCRLAGEADDRCTRARTSVRTHFQRVASCRCKLGS
jgi:hypothetical protein